MRGLFIILLSGSRKFSITSYGSCVHQGSTNSVKPKFSSHPQWYYSISIFLKLPGTYFLPSDMFWDDAAVLLQLSPLATNEQILVRMGMSFISTDQACSNAEAEIPAFDFDAVSQSSISNFEGILNRIRVDITNVTDDVLSLFYSSVSMPKYN